MTVFVLWRVGCWRVRVSYRTSAAEDAWARSRTDADKVNTRNVRGRWRIIPAHMSSDCEEHLRLPDSVLPGSQLPKNRVDWESLLCPLRGLSFDHSSRLKSGRSAAGRTKVIIASFLHFDIRKIEFGPPLRNTECGEATSCTLPDRILVLAFFPFPVKSTVTVHNPYHSQFSVLRVLS